MDKAVLLSGLLALAVAAPAHAGGKDNVPPKGYKALFNGKNLDGWQGVVPINQRAKMTPDQYEKAVEAANKKILPHWSVEDGVLIYDGQGNSLQTVKDYRNFDLLVDWKIKKDGDSGIYLRGVPQVQIWERPEGSGGLYNNQKNPKDPLVNADNPPGEWNTFHITMKGDKVTVRLNGKTVVDNVPLENYWDRSAPLPEAGPVELQHHGNTLYFKNIFVKELP